MATGSRIRQIGWALVLGTCFALLLGLTFKVNAVKSDVRLVERKIIAAEQAKLMLETEFQTRANQQQLANWNAVEFGYGAPRADQYLENERQLAALGSPRGVNAPAPIRVAMNDAPRQPAQDGLLGDWLADGDDAPAEARRPARENMAAVEPRTDTGTSLAQRLTKPAAGMVAVHEVAQ